MCRSRADTATSTSRESKIRAQEDLRAYIKGLRRGEGLFMPRRLWLAGFALVLLDGRFNLFYVASHRTGGRKLQEVPEGFFRLVHLFLPQKTVPEDHIDG